MKRRKIVGLALLMGTIVYLLASLLALYQNQRVKMEKGMEEVLKTYSNKEELNMKELSKDFNLMLEEKMDITEGKDMILKFEGSFDKMESNVNQVNDELAEVEYNITSLNERQQITENNIKVIYDELVLWEEVINEKILKENSKLTEVENSVTENEKNISNLQKSIEECKANQDKDINLINENISEIKNIMNQNQESHIKDVEVIEKIIAETEQVINENQQNYIKDVETINNAISVLENVINNMNGATEEETDLLQHSLEELREKVTYLENNVLYYQYDEDSATLNVYGKEEAAE